MELRDLPPDKDPKGGSPKTPYPPPRPPRTPNPIRVSEFDEYNQGNPTTLGGLDTKDILAWVFRSLCVLAFFWMKATFVTNEKYDSDKGKTLQELLTISNTLTRIDEKLNKGSGVDSDHEARLRELEKNGKQPK